MLVIDDHEFSRVVLIALLVHLGFTVRSADNGAHGFKVLAHWSATIIWLDRTMPDMHRLTFVSRLRQMESESDFYVVATTANAFDLHKMRFIKAGCDDFLRKPIESEKLNAAIARYLPLDATPQLWIARCNSPFWVQ